MLLAHAGKIVAAALLALLLAGCASSGPAGSREGGFDFALIGDMPYTRAQEREYQRVLAALNSNDLAFVAHIGDFQFDARPYNRDPSQAAMPCVEENYQAVLTSFQSVRQRPRLRSRCSN